MKYQIGDIIEFKAYRITNGNPVKGVLLSEDGEWFAVKLMHDIEGLVSVWYEGDTKSFRRGHCGPFKILKGE